MVAGWVDSISAKAFGIICGNAENPKCNGDIRVYYLAITNYVIPVVMYLTPAFRITYVQNLISNQQPIRYTTKTHVELCLNQ